MVGDVVDVQIAGYRSPLQIPMIQVKSHQLSRAAGRMTGFSNFDLDQFFI
jgi:hypothetical protein